MSTNVTWPGGENDTAPTSFAIPSGGDQNWSSLSSFLLALGSSAQTTSFQKFGIRVGIITPVTVSTTDCVICTNLTTPGPVSVILPPGESKQIFIISDDKGDAGTNNITIIPSSGQTIAGFPEFILNGNRDSAIICFYSVTLDWKLINWSSHL